LKVIYHGTFFFLLRDFEKNMALNYTFVGIDFLVQNEMFDHGICNNLEANC
jgi:hypothetical protein